MKDNQRNALIGLFVLCGLMALGILIVKFGESSWLFRQGYRIDALFEQIPGLREGTDVKLAGVSIGRVVEVDLVDPRNPAAGVKAVLEIRKEYSVLEDSKATVVVPLMGNPSINIMPPGLPTEPLATDGTGNLVGAVIDPIGQLTSEGIVDTVKTTTEQIRQLAEAFIPAAEAVAGLLEERTIEDVEKSQGTDTPLSPNLYTAINRLDKVLGHMDVILGDGQVQGDLRETIANLRKASENMNVAVVDLQEFGKTAQAAAAEAHAVIKKFGTTVDTTNRHVDMLAEKAAMNLDQMSKLLDHLGSAAEDLAEGDGTLGKLLRDSKLHEALLLTIERLADAAGELRVLVKKYQTKSLFGP